MVKIDESRCVGCGICANICPDGMEMVNGIAKIKDSNADCLKAAASACPRQAIMLDGGEINSQPNQPGIDQDRGMGRGQGMGGGRGRGMGRGRGKGMGGGKGRRRG